MPEASDLTGCLETAVAAARRAGELIRDNCGTLSSDDISLKQASDFVTRVDTESEALIISIIRERFPNHLFLAEESLREAETDEFRWIIDPLDGTTNYIHGFPLSVVSIALQYRRNIVIGVIFDPFRNELFTASIGDGACMDGKKITVSTVFNVSSALIATGFPFKRKDLIDPYLTLFKNIFLEVSDIRRAGSAALDLAYIACGRFDGFFEIGLGPWDCAAGSLIIKEAGGVITNFSGGENFLESGNIVAGNALIHAMLLDKVKKVFAGMFDI
ncbi:MAG: inositol monophosphatase family protein [Dissulfurispiraceae bacterium]|jgi:myo-inositol-1(or 4)-monophosphatase